MITLKDLAPKFDAFELMNGDERKNAVRALEQDVRTGQVVLTDTEFQLSRLSALQLQRILTYLMTQHGRPTSGADMRANLVNEMERVKRKQFTADYPRMPLYYATRAFLECVRSNAALRSAAAADIPFLREIESDLSHHSVDIKGQVLPKVREAISLITHDEREDVGIRAARITRRGAITVGIIGLIGVLITAIINAMAKKPDAPSTRAAGAPKDTGATTASGKTDRRR